MDSNWIEVYGARRSIKPHLEVVFSGSEIELKDKNKETQDHDSGQCCAFAFSGCSNVLDTCSDRTHTNAKIQPSYMLISMSACLLQLYSWRHIPLASLHVVA